MEDAGDAEAVEDAGEEADAVEADTDTAVAAGTPKAVAEGTPKAARPDRCTLAGTAELMCTSAAEAGEAAAALLPQQAVPAPAAEGVTNRPRAPFSRRFKT